MYSIDENIVDSRRWCLCVHGQIEQVPLVGRSHRVYLLPLELFLLLRMMD